MEGLERWEDGWRVRLPLPFPLKWIYAYLLPGSDGYAIIDSGLHTDEAWRTWWDVWKHLNIDPRSVRTIVLTHYHPDHYGLTGRLQQYTGADVWMSPLTVRYAQLNWKDVGQLEKMVSFYQTHGLPDEAAHDMKRDLTQFREWVSPHPHHIQTFEGGDRLTLGDRTYEVWHTPGHAEDHVSFFDPEREWLVGGDALLRKITPNISLYPGHDPNPLQTYFVTLKKLRQKNIRRVLPAHGPAFDDVHVRIRELIDHHEERLHSTEQLVDGTRTAYDICLQLFGTNLSIHNLRFALAETLAHLEYLRSEGRLVLAERGEGVTYEPS